ncbi:hypothetical protein IAD21_04852 [Abditibacteriota bacterium]|nr:hypothetical protein IAD21_04852 [Abditibacteriota bacterium]
MKKLICLFLLAAPAYAQETPPAPATPPVPPAAPAPEPERGTVIAPIPPDAPLVSAPVAARDLTVEIVGNNIALVRDARRLQLQTGANRLRLVGIPATRTTLGLNVTPRVRVLRDLGSRPPASAAPQEKFDLAKFIGQKITILRPVGTDEKTVTGTLLSVQPLLVDTGSGVLLNPTGQWVLPSGSAKAQLPPATTPDDTKAEPEWILGAPQGGDYLAEYRYQLTGLKFAPLYTATLQDDRVRLEGVINVQNDLGEEATRDLRGMSLVVADGTVRFVAPVALTEGANSFGFASGEAPLQARFSFRRSTPFEQSFQNQLAARSVFIENTPQNGLGVFLPPGVLVLNRTALQNGQPTTSLVSQNNNWGGFAPGGQIDLPLGPSNTVKVSRTVTSRLLNPVTREWTVEFSIRSDEQLALSEPLPADARLQEATPKPDTSERGVLRWILPSATEPTVVKYTIETPA